MVKARLQAIALGGALAVSGAACKPEFAERSSLVRSVRVLAIKSEPAEEQPRAMSPTMQYTALVVDPIGPRDDVSLDWAFCTEPKPVNELNDVSQACFTREASFILPLTSTGSAASGPLPGTGCRQFGPNPPELEGGVLGRPADPDSTGGYYQPVRVLSKGGDGVEAVGQTRLRCDVAGASPEIAREYSFRYRNNANPAIDELVAVQATEQTLVPDGPGVVPLEVAAGAGVHLRLAWSMCDANVPCPPGATDQCDEPGPCTGAESYVLYDLANRRLVVQRESMRVSWFATAGSFANDTTGRGVDEYLLLSTENDWTAPVDTTEAVLWAVLRDSRGGVSWNRYRVTVR
jgi:hypothetical protein